ncbi:MAG: CBS domain-containing protein [Cyanobacteria bacterium REEB67]|nr:CBS domain-containing protein [Cyanobacteria bacterium REEB67]
MTRCGDLMKLNPTSRALNATAVELANVLKEESAGPLAIVDVKNGNKLIGVVTFKDLVVGVLAEDRSAKETTALDILSHEKQFCRSEDSISRAITLMDRYHVSELPVVDSKMHLVGTILQEDISHRLEDPEIPLDAASVDLIMSGQEDLSNVRTIL